MRVLHLINTLSVGGAELHLLTLARHLKRQDVEVVVACLREQVKGSRSLRPDFEKEHIGVVHLQADSRYDWRFVTRFLRLLKEQRPDVVHTHLPRADLAAALGKFLHPSIIWVSSVHDIYNKSWSGRWAVPLFSSIWRQADSVVAISHAVKQWLVDDQGLLPGNVRVVHYGIELERFSRATVNLRERWCLNGGAVIGSIGRLEPRKAHDCLIEAMAAAFESAANACLLIAGHDPWGYGKDLQALINDLELEKRVKLVGFQDDVPSFLGALDVFAFASRSEGFGQVVIEAMAAGKPVVASKIPPLTEIVIEGETGLLVEPRDAKSFAEALTHLLIDPVERRRMGMRGRERVKEYFTAERMAQETLLLYEELLQRRSAFRSIA